MLTISLGHCCLFKYRLKRQGLFCHVHTWLSWAAILVFLFQAAECTTFAGQLVLACPTPSSQFWLFQTNGFGPAESQRQLLGWMGLGIKGLANTTGDDKHQKLMQSETGIRTGRIWTHTQLKKVKSEPASARSIKHCCSCNHGQLCDCIVQPCFPTTQLALIAAAKTSFKCQGLF